MTDNMKKFLELASGDAELVERLNGMDKDAIIAAAQQRGIALTEADFAADTGAELNEDELDAVAGGGKCACVLGGGGKADDNCNKCSCILDGAASSRTVCKSLRLRWRRRRRGQMISRRT